MATRHRQTRGAGNTDTLGARIVAYFIDSIIASVIGGGLAFVGFILAGVLGSVSEGLGALVLFLFVGLAFAGAVGYKVYFEANGGQPFGKQMMDIKVVMDDGRECTWGASIIRNLLLGFEGGLIAVIVIAVTDDSQRIGDLLGSTVVVKA
ncbi:RDD family protein [Haloarchaeobius sp. FL176]|uniref:RDD family protein n=1 Tax=Haloarchaeobius sp. FL176 TaxID=2967129 RepID=UPI0021486DBB|nr:RDD family protein [Haloarchaeobius sp. FL176]